MVVREDLHGVMRHVFAPDHHLPCDALVTAMQDIFSQVVDKCLHILKSTATSSNTHAASADLGIIPKLRPLIQSSLGSVTRPCPFPVTVNGEGWVPSPRGYMVEVIGAHVDGPIRIEMTL